MGCHSSHADLWGTPFLTVETLLSSCNCVLIVLPPLALTYKQVASRLCDLRLAPQKNLTVCLLHFMAGLRVAASTHTRFYVKALLYLL